jgi:hypothetical protein
MKKRNSEVVSELERLIGVEVDKKLSVWGWSFIRKISIISPSI